jgi:hypothetical protein
MQKGASTAVAKFLRIDLPAPLGVLGGGGSRPKSSGIINSDEKIPPRQRRSRRPSRRPADELRTDFAAAIHHGKLDAALATLRSLNPAPRWMVHSLAHAYGRCRLADDALALLSASASTSEAAPAAFAAALRGLAASEHAPFGLPASVAKDAERIFHAMVTQGVRPDANTYDALMLCQAKAGALSDVLSACRSMLAVGLALRPASLSHVLTAGARGGMLRDSRYEALQLARKSGITPNTHVWNGLLRAAAAESVDAAYETFQQMLDSGGYYIKRTPHFSFSIGVHYTCFIGHA